MANLLPLWLAVQIRARKQGLATQTGGGAPLAEVIKEVACVSTSDGFTI